MPLALKNIKITGITVATKLVYTVPAATTVMVTGFQIANTDGTNSQGVTVDVAGTKLANNVSIPIGSAFIPTAGQILTLVAGNTINVAPAVDAVLDVVLSITERT